MGMFDSVMVPCPACGTQNEFQSKGAADCRLKVYKLENCPPDVMLDINRHAPIACSNCKVLYEVKLTITGNPVKSKNKRGRQ